MIINNKLKVINKKLYKMKYINTLNKEYKTLENNEVDRIEKFDDKKVS